MVECANESSGAFAGQSIDGSADVQSAERRSAQRGQRKQAKGRGKGSGAVSRANAHSPAQLNIKPISVLSLMLTPLPKSKAAMRKRQVAFERTLESLANQGLPYWQWLVAVRAADFGLVSEWLERCDIDEDSRANVELVAYEAGEAATDMSPSTPKAIARLLTKARGDWVGMCFVGDAFAPHFVYESLGVALKQPDVLMMYFDDDVLSPSRSSFLKELGLPAFGMARCDPQFKLDWSVDELLCRNYIGLSFLARKDVFSRAVNVTKPSLQRLGGELNSPLNFPLNFPYWLVLSCVSQIERDQSAALGRQSRLRDDYAIKHLPKILRHRDVTAPESVRFEQSKAAQMSGKRCVQAFLAGRGCSAKVSLGEGGALRVDWPLPKGGAKALPKVSIIVPTKDQFKILKKCVDSLIEKTDYANLELIIVDNQTTDAKALSYLASLQKKYGFVTVLKYDKPFNYSDINNWAAKTATGDVLLLMNNDVEVLDGGWLKAMVKHAIRDEVGCVGAKLLFPDRTIQHAGVAVGIHGVADHMYRSMEETELNDPYGCLRVVRNPLAVTAAVLAIRRPLFEALGGLDAKRFKVAFNDVDLCLRAEEAGYRTVWTPEACLVHHESKTRAPKTKLSNDIGAKARATERQEVNSMKRGWGWVLRRKFNALSTRVEQLRVL